jgi:hypothetical protein
MLCDNCTRPRSSCSGTRSRNIKAKHTLPPFTPPTRGGHARKFQTPSPKTLNRLRDPPLPFSKYVSYGHVLYTFVMYIPSGPFKVSVWPEAPGFWTCCQN